MLTEEEKRKEESRFYSETGLILSLEEAGINVGRNLKQDHIYYSIMTHFSDEKGSYLDVESGWKYNYLPLRDFVDWLIEGARRA